MTEIAHLNVLYVLMNDFNIIRIGNEWKKMNLSYFFRSFKFNYKKFNGIEYYNMR